MKKSFKESFENKMAGIKKWWNNSQKKWGKVLGTFGKVINRIALSVIRLMIIGVLVNIIASYFYPEFSSRFPVIYGWFDGWLQLGEFIYKTALGGIYSLFTGNFNEFTIEVSANLHELWLQFIEWLSQISF